MTSSAVTSLSRIQFAFCFICMWSFIPLAVAEVEERWQPLNQKPRLLVLTDIEADPDDAQTLIRLLLYANQIDIKGLIATTSVHQKTRIAPDTIHTLIDAYGEVQPNLNSHQPGYPDAKTLHSIVKSGVSVYGMQGVGENHDSEGSDWLIREIEKADSRPLWISVWGGTNTLAQALYKLKKTKSENVLKQLINRLRVYTISDQDDSAAWIRQTFPNLFYIVSPGGYGAATWTGINHVVQGIDNTRISNAWIAEHIQQGHGPLGAKYPDVAYGMEGDTPSWLNLINNGLHAPEHPNWGGWGGRYERYIPKLSETDPTGFTGGVPVVPETRPIWTNAVDRYVPVSSNQYGRTVSPGSFEFNGYRETLWRWRDEFQNDFAARMDWCMKRYDEANHAPEVKLLHDHSITVKSGESFHLDARGSKDPDGDALQFYWFNYAEAGTMKDQTVKIHSAENMARVHVVAPDVEKPQSIHFILKLTDRGEPALTSYARVVVRVEPH